MTPRFSPSDTHSIVQRPDVHHLLLAMLRLRDTLRKLAEFRLEPKQ
jgi:hypothetical protein